MGVRSVIALVCVVGGHGKSEQPPSARPTPAPTVQLPIPVAVPEFPDWTRSLELVRTVGVRLEPADDAKRIRTVAIDTRVGWTPTEAGKGCDKPWVLIEPRGWVCGDYVQPSKKPPYGQEVPPLDRREI